MYEWLPLLFPVLGLGWIGVVFALLSIPRDIWDKQRLFKIVLAGFAMCAMAVGTVLFMLLLFKLM